MEQNSAHHYTDIPERVASNQYPPLGLITRPAVDTDSAAHYLNRKAQTLRTWACYENGPIRPIRVHGRLAWSVDEIRKVLGVSHV
ncbi:MAG: hypothetical protein EBQ78_00365 [Betaproteobacteria bacterium]|jgi:hypothetical protein|nr:hypothetical protein [Betaproteobacteria bacterium]